ncbi:DUF4349 domain-containing protein [Sphingomonas mesophila]|uniref:DUF4349 domain-containing protein n=1 Tax=Sphingomonas mesophila TaxID=2303576 RepID=UPI000E56751A|nr:DUF4349 domain-containing protein [Sphingomonas mesophila]
MFKRRIGMVLAALALLGACSDGAERGQVGESADLAEDVAAAPGIVPTAAPGVAFTYSYGFQLADPAISAAQEEHAAACEKLGLERCRITGMTYRLDERDRVEGTLKLAIDPLLARSFGRDAIAVVQRRDGALRYTEIEGEDQNPALEDAARREGGASVEIARLEAALRTAKGDEERVALRQQLRELRDQVEQAQAQETTAEAKIRRTPMNFTYLGGASGRGFAGENPVREAWYLFVDSVAMMVGFLLKALAVLLPWALLIALLVMLARSRPALRLRRWWGSDADHDASQAS